jgi:hypothetical protein
MMQGAGARTGRAPAAAIAALPALLALALLASLVVASGGQAAPSTFGPVIGNAVLCRSHLDNAYFHAYLTRAFGPSYKREGGAFWFKSDATLWGTPISDIIVSDDSSAVTFLGAVAEATPDQLDAAIRAAGGSAYIKVAKAGSAPFAERESGPGSKIVHFKARSKVFCAKFKPPAPGP